MGRSKTSTAGEPSSRPRRTVVAWSSVGAVTVVLGLVLLLTSPSPASFGWFAYAPLSDATFSPVGMLLTSQAGIGLVIGVSGLLVLAFCGGWVLGARRRR